MTGGEGVDDRSGWILLNGVIERLALTMLRAVSPMWRARTDLFSETFRSRIRWMSGLDDGGRVLHALVRMTRPRTIVEIGSARGFSTCALALACAENRHGRVFAIDPHLQNEWTDVGTGGNTHDFLVGRLRAYQLGQYCTVIRQGSEEAGNNWNREIDLLFIDGDHTLMGVRRDFETFGRWLNPEGIVIFHDSGWEHNQAWNSFRGESWFRDDMGVPAYLDDLQKRGYQSVTFLPVPGLTIMHPGVGGFDFLRRNRVPE
jgi:predicted O-methyltransferase YrrM